MYQLQNRQKAQVIQTVRVCLCICACGIEKVENEANTM